MNTPPRLKLHQWEVLAEPTGSDSSNHEAYWVYYRIVGIRHSSTGEILAVAVLNLSNERFFPEVFSAEEILHNLETQKWIRSNFDPLVPKIRSLGDIKESKRKRALECMRYREAIVEYADKSGWQIFNPRKRTQIIRKAMKRAGDIYLDGACNTVAWGRKILKRHWRFGGSSFAHLPGTLLNGKRSREVQYQQAQRTGTELSFGKKTGRKSHSLDSAHCDGLEITADLYPKLRAAILEVIETPRFKRELASAYDRRRGIPWTTLTDQVNAKILPRCIWWTEKGAELADPKKIRRLTPNQIRTVGRTLFGLGDFVLKIKDPRQILLDHRPPRGDFRDVVSYAGQRYSVDVALLDAFIVHDGTRISIGRVYVAFVVDCFSRAIVGIYPWAGNPSSRIVTYALAAAAMPKSEWGRIIGEPISDDEWDCQGLPETLVCDNGEAATHGCDHFGELTFDVSPNRPFFAFWKQEVETSFRLANIGYVNLLPASTKGPKQRHSEDPEKKALVSMSELTRQLSRWAYMTANHRVLENFPEHEELIREGVPNTPIALYRASRRMRGGSLRPFVKERHIPALMESRDATVKPEGIDLSGVYFDFDDESRPTWLTKLKRDAVAGPRKSIRIHFDRMLLNRVYLVPKDPHKPVVEIPLSRLSRQWRNYSFEEYFRVREHVKEQNKIAKHGQKVREVAFNQSVEDDLSAARDSLKALHGTIRYRNKAAKALGKESFAGDQMHKDALRDQEMHPNVDTFDQLSESDDSDCKGVNVLTYDQLLGL